MIYNPKKRLATQFKNKPKLSALLNAFIDNELEVASNDLLKKRGLDSAVDKQLDGIGEIIGLQRPREPQTSTGKFGFLADDDARGFTTLNNPTDGGFFSQINPPLVVPIDDDKYRIAIKGKIFQNHTNMTVDETLNILSIIFQTDIKYYLPGNLEPMYEINRSLYPYERDILSQFPQTIGIKNVLFKSTEKDSGFGFAEDSTALGFTTLLDGSIGGNLSALI